ncbi:MAG: hypothetical protein ACJ77N_08660 [Chloroflexota bacterium]
MPTRLALVVPVLVIIAGCSSTGAAPSGGVLGANATPVAAAQSGSLAAAASSAAAPTSRPSPLAPSAAAGGPHLAVTLVRDSIRASVTDTAAKAWRIVIGGGTGDANAAPDRLEIVVETSDVEAAVHVDEYVGGRLVDENDVTSQVGDATAAAGGCHRTLGVCYSSGSIRVPHRDGRLTVDVTPTEQHPLIVSGGSARWPGEPFILGPWRTTSSWRSDGG